MGSKRQKLTRRQKKAFKKQLLQQQKESETVSAYFETSKLTLQDYSSVSDDNYTVYRIMYSSEKIGYLGIRKNGKFKLNIVKKENVGESANENVIEDDVIHFSELYISTQLGLRPINVTRNI